MKISITLDVSKIDKTKIKERTFINKGGVEVTAKDYKLDVVPLKEKKIIKEGDNWILYKTHFVAEPQTKEERDNGQPSNIIGDGVVFEDKIPQQAKPDEIVYPVDDIDPEDIPF